MPHLSTKDIAYLKNIDKCYFDENCSEISYEALDDSSTSFDSLLSTQHNLSYLTAVSIRAWLVFDDKGEILDDNKRSASDYDVRVLFAKQILTDNSLTIKINDKFTYQDVIYQVFDVKDTDITGQSGLFLRTEALCKRYKIVSTHVDPEPMEL